MFHMQRSRTCKSLFLRMWSCAGYAMPSENNSAITNTERFGRLIDGRILVA